MLHVTSVAFSFASLFVSAIVFNDIEERAVDPVDRNGHKSGVPAKFCFALCSVGANF